MKKRLTIWLIIVTFLLLVGFIIFNKSVTNNTNFAMYISDIYSIGEDTYVTGTIKKGNVRLNDKIKIFIADDIDATIKEIIVDKKKVNQAGQDTFIALNIGNVDQLLLKRGILITNMEMVNNKKVIESKNITIRLNDKDKVKTDNIDLVFKIGNENYAGKVTKLKNNIITVVLDEKVPVYRGLDVIVKTDGLREITTGFINKID